MQTKIHLWPVPREIQANRNKEPFMYRFKKDRSAVSSPDRRRRPSSIIVGALEAKVAPGRFIE